MNIQRVLHNKPACRVCCAGEGFIRTAAPAPAPFPNPYYNRNPQPGHQSQGGQFGHHWYHGTTSSSFQDEDDEVGNYNPDQHDRFKTPVERGEFDGVGNGRNSEHWNTDLGTHFTGLKDVAKNSFASSKIHRDPVVPGSRIAHTSLHMANPKHYEDEKAMDDHAVSWAKDAGHSFLPAGSHDALHGGSHDFVSGLYGRVTDHPEAQHNYDDFHSVATSREDRDLISKVDKSSSQDLHKLPVNASALWLQHHPARQNIIEGFRQHVMDQGHDGMTYGNTYEGPKHHTSAIAFPSTPMTIHHWEPVGPAKPQRASDRDDLRQMHMFDKAASQSTTFNYIHNPRSSQSHGVDPERYGQHIEPHGKYISEQTGNHVPEGWQSGSVTFHNPKRLEFGGGYQEPSNWKHRLSSEYDGKTGSDLSKALIKDGHDGIITHDKYGTSEIVDLTNFKSRKQAALDPDTGLPTERVFGRTYGLDHRLWQDRKLKDGVSQPIIKKFNDYCRRHDYLHWQLWAKIVFFGSEASEWTSPALEGNNDFDLSIGLEYDTLRQYNPEFANLGDQDIATRFTDEMHAELNNEKTWYSVPEQIGPFDQTWFANLLGWDIRKMKPYSAYDVVAQEWIVVPPSLPDWDIHSFPQGEGLVEEIRGMLEMARGILAMPEPYRTQQGSQFWHYIHDTRANAFGENGEGWFDSSNILEKAMDQSGLLQPLWDCMQKAKEHPDSLRAPELWSNDPKSLQGTQ